MNRWSRRGPRMRVAGAGQRDQHHRGVVGVGVEGVAVLEEPAARLDAANGLRPSRRSARTSLSSSQRTAVSTSSASPGLPASARAMSDSAVSHTGDLQGCKSQRVVLLNTEVVELLHHPLHFGMSSGGTPRHLRTMA